MRAAVSGERLPEEPWASVAGPEYLSSAGGRAPTSVSLGRNFRHRVTLAAEALLERRRPTR
jgi:hypothetical protein